MLARELSVPNSPAAGSSAEKRQSRSQLFQSFSQKTCNTGVLEAFSMKTYFQL